jgi:large subunit ribosomal protein L17
MRHGVKLNRLGRKTAHRHALLANLACQLIEHKRIITTLAKAKSLRVYVEPMVSRSKNDTTHNRRVVFSKLQSKEAIKELFSTVSQAVGTRPGGYTRVIKLGNRTGDAAEMAMIELVDFNTIYTGKAVEATEKKRTRRSKAASGTSTAPKSAAKEVAAVAEEAPIAEVVDTPEVEVTAPIAEVETNVTEAVTETPAEVPADAVATTETPAEDTPATDAEGESTEEKA